MTYDTQCWRRGWARRMWMGGQEGRERRWGSSHTRVAGTLIFGCCAQTQPSYYTEAWPAPCPAHPCSGTGEKFNASPRAAPASEQRGVGSAGGEFGGFREGGEKRRRKKSGPRPLHSRFDTSTVCNMCACTINCIAMCKSASKWHKSQEGNIRAIRSSVAGPSEPSPTHRFAGGVSFPQLQYWHITACRVFNDSGCGSKRLGPHSRCACQHAARADAC